MIMMKPYEPLGNQW